ncbi:MAG: hypothetical protein PWQ29_509 [Verrucomicrobiota bacterium]|jgi:hypothetical protein|nr:hypothetical protein [Verrucomicrobiota bacterium]MDK2963115.1 hypothetical protein [Verrucomicrobiota bacterium]
MNALTADYTDQICKEIESLPEDADQSRIDETFQRLQAMNYQPILLVDAPGFLTMTRAGLLEFIRNLVKEQNGLTEQHLSLLVYHYRLLQRLRRDEPEAWDEINELMEDD